MKNVADGNFIVLLVFQVVSGFGKLEFCITLILSSPCAR